jgi:hypothetical protein
MSNDLPSSVSQLDPVRRRQLLEWKLQANNQRNGRATYLQVLPPDLAAYLQTCEFIVTPELDELLAYFWLREDNADRDKSLIPAYQYQELSWPKQIFELVRSFNSKYDAVPAYFYPHGDCPIFCTTMGWLRQNIEVLFPLVHGTGHTGQSYSPERLGAIAIDLSVGIVISNYCGYVLSDPNPWEQVYTVAMWGKVVRN